MANNDYITTDCKLTVSKNTVKLDEEIFLYKNDRNIKLLIEIVDNKYRYKSDDLSNLLVKYKASYAQVKWYKNAEVKKEFPIQATDDGKVVFVIEGQLIDEDTELGDYDLQLRLLNESQESIRSLPIIKGAVHILKPLFEEGDIATVNSAVADVSMLSLDGDAIDTYNSDGTYNQTNWGNGDVISSAKLNKLEKVAKDNVDKVNKMPAKSIVEGGKIYLAKEDGTKLDSGTELPASGSGTPYDDTEIKTDINTIKTDLGTEELTTTAKNVKGAVNEVNAQYKDIANLEDTGFTSKNLKGILQEIYNVLSNNNLMDKFNITIGNNIPEVYLNGDITNMSKTNPIDLGISIKINGFEWTGVANTKWQGNSSLAYDKKNFTIKLYEDSTKATKQKINFNNWGKQNKFVLKANYIDHSHARNIVSARIWSDIVACRSDYSTLPQELRTSPNNCAINGFPIKVTINDTYQGLYTWNIPKDAWMFNMDENNANHAVLCAEINNNGNTTAITACQFRQEAAINGDWSLEIPDNLNANIKTSFNNLINFVINSSDSQFKYGIDKYLDVQSAIDYYIYAYYGGFIDSLAKNLIMMTFDGTKWFASMYDMDSTWGLYFDGGHFVSNNIQCPEQYQETNSLLWQRIEKCFAKELKERYTELRTNILSVEHITKLFNDFMSIIGNELFAKDLEAYPSIPQGKVNHLQQITDFVTARSTYVDSEINSLVETDISKVAVTSLVLDKENLNLNISDNIQNVDISKIAKYSGREIYGTTEATVGDTTKILTDFIELNNNNIYLYMSNSPNNNTRWGAYSSKDDSNPEKTITLNASLDGGYVAGYNYIKLMSNDNFENEKLIAIKNDYINSIMSDMDTSGLNIVESDMYIPITVSKGDILFCKPSKAGYWNGFASSEGGSKTQNNNLGNLIVLPINTDIDKVYLGIQGKLFISGGTLKYKLLNIKDLNIDNSQIITAALSPSDATNKNVIWTSDNENVEIVANGLKCTVKAKATGSSVITCTSEDTTNGTISDTCNIIIN